MAEALATKYRPKNWEDVSGQENILTILQNQIEANDTKQAYLFCGGAGTGKTTIARIFARAINGNVEPLEIDAASNNGVDQVREIREACKYKPLGAQFKVYLIDEVHMLSTGAFNALLKTLEEPPAHVVFILCTTDPQKIPATILSRVQRFDYKRLKTEQIIERLEYIIGMENVDFKPFEVGETLACMEDYANNFLAGSTYNVTLVTETGVVLDDLCEVPFEQLSVFDRDESVSVDYPAIEYLAKLADGGMRDAISLLDTCLSYKKEVYLTDVMEILGASSYDDYIQLMEILTHMNGYDKKDLIALIERIHLDGKDLKQFVKGFAGFVVDLRKVQLLKNFDYVSVPSVYYTLMDAILFGMNETYLDDLFTSLSSLTNLIKYERHPKYLIEGSLLQL